MRDLGLNTGFQADSSYEFLLICSSFTEALDDLLSILDSARTYGKENNQPTLVTNIDKVLENLKKLEADKAIRGKEDNYEVCLRTGLVSGF